MNPMMGLMGMGNPGAAPMAMQPSSMDMAMMLQGLQDPMALAQSSPGQAPLSAEEQALLNMITNAGKKPVPTPQIPAIMQMLSMMTGGPNAAAAMPPTAPGMGAMPGMMPGGMPMTGGY